MRLIRTVVLAVAPLVFLVACGGPSGTKPTSASTNPAATPVVVALGDSLTAGPGLQADETYPANLQRKALASGYRHRIVNAGASGDTSTDIARRFDAVVGPDTRVLILEVGANDGLQGLPIDVLFNNVSAMVAKAKARGIQVLLCGMETPPTRGWQYSIDFHHVFPDIAEEYHVPLMPFMLEGVFGIPQYNLGDGVHPNARGAAIIADNMWPYLEPLLKQTE